MPAKLLIAILMLAASCFVSAQTAPSVTYTVKGILADSLTQEPEPYATIRIVNKAAPDKVVKMAVTDNNGKFQEKITGDGTFLITITSIGKSTVTKEFALSPETRTVDLGTLYTSDAANELAGVEVVAQKPLVKVDLDKIEYNVEDDPDSKTNSVLEMLRKVPLVTVDGEDKIQVNGSSSFKVHINGKPNNMMSDNPTEVLKSMPANSIKNIEVITNPGAKYDAEGIGGILNIITVGGGLGGYTATFSTNVSNMGAGGSIYATVKQNKFTLTGNYSANYNDRPRSYTNNTREYYESRTTERSEGWSKYKGTFQHGNLEASYELDTLRLFSVSFGMYGGGGDNKGGSDSWLEPAPEASTAGYLYRYHRETDGDNSWYSIRGSVDYQRSFSVKDRLLTFSYQLNTRPQTSDGYTSYSYREEEMPADWLKALRLVDMRSDGEENTTEHTFQGDYTTPIGKYHTLGTGVKYILRNNKSDNDRYEMGEGGAYVYDDERSSHYKHENNIIAAYADYSVKYKSLMGKVGVRAEHTIQDVKYAETPERNFDTNYNDIVPSASIGLKLGQSQNLRFAYDMRIWRPSIYFLNPYLDDSNPTYIRRGNPNLETEKSHRFNLSFSSFTQKFNINLTLRHVFNNNAIEGITKLVDPADIPGYLNPVSDKEVLYSTYDNIGKRTGSGISAYINWNASPKTRIYMNASGDYNTFKSTARDLKNSGWDVFAYGGIQHTLPHDIRLSLNLMGSSPRISLQGRGGGFYNYGLNVNKSFLDKRLTISAFANNLFEGRFSYKNKTYEAAFKDVSESRFVTRRFGVSVSYRIGELKAQVKKASRTISNDDVKEGGGSEGGGQE